MHRTFCRRLLAPGAGAALLLLGLPLGAATYLPLCDAGLFDRSPVVVAARILDRDVRLESVGGIRLPVTRIRFAPLEVLKGGLPPGDLRLVLPGGETGGVAFRLPGTPALPDGEEAILFLAPLPERPGEFGLTEFGLSVFDVLVDPAGRRFAVRSLFQSGEERFLSDAGASEPDPDGERDDVAFRAALRAAAAGAPMPRVPRGAPAGPLRLSRAGRTADWVNIGGPEGGTGTLFRWFWDTVASPDARVVPVGTQSNLTDGTYGLEHVANAATQWGGVAYTAVEIGYDPAATSGVIQVLLDVGSYAGGGDGVWSSPLPCDGGVLGSGGPSGTGAWPFKGATYAAIQGGTIWMRKSDCVSGYDAATFRSAVLHEVGHALGLGHPDQAQSPYSATSPADWDAAVMRSAVPPAKPDTPQIDDAAALRYYYGIGGPGGGGPSAPVASFTFSPAAPVAGDPIQFTDTSTGPPATWAWSFGDGTISSAQYPQKTYASPGVYSVHLTVTNALGSSSTSRSVTVSQRTLPPVANFTYAPASPGPGQNITFTDTSSNAPTSWSWSFGDGTGSTAQNPLKTYTAAGTYTVSLTATNAYGSGTAQRTVFVGSGQAVPVASDSAYATTLNTVLVIGAPGVLSSVTNPNSDVLVAVLVSTTASGTLSLNLNGSFVYAPNSGFTGMDSFTFKAHETSFGHDSNVATVRISVSAVLPVAAFTFTPAIPRAGEPLQFTDASTGVPNAWAWDFGDGSTANLQNPAKTYAQPGSYTVVLSVTNAAGSASTSRPVVVTALFSPPTALPATFDTVLNTPLDAPPPGVLAGASNPAGGPLEAILASDVTLGTLALAADGSFRYVPARNFTGTDTFRFLARDPATGLSSDAATVTLRVLEAVDTVVVPIVLEASGRAGSYFTTELTLVNRGTRRASLRTDFTSSKALTGSDAGSGTVRDQLDAGHQIVTRNAISYLRAAGMPIAEAPPQGGSLRLTLSGLSATDVTFALARTTSATGNGHAGLAYSAVSLRHPPAASVLLFGLRETAAERTNLALVNAGTNGPVTLRVTLVPAGGGADVAAGDWRLDPGQWRQLNSVLNLASLSEGWARVERVEGTEPFLAYAVVNDNVTSDGAFVAAVPAARAAEPQLLPVLVESPGFTSELVLANPGGDAVTAELVYVESSASPQGPAGSVLVPLAPRSQQILPGAVAFLRAGGAAIGPPGASYAGAVRVRFLEGDGTLAAGFAGARTSSPAPSGGLYGLSYPAAGTSELAASEAWVFGLQQTATTRSNLAFVNAGADPLALHVEVFDGDTGASPPAVDYSVPPGGWFQANSFLRRFQLENGYVRITRTGGAGPFLAYAVLNDGANPGEGTSDGSYVPMAVVR